MIGASPGIDAIVRSARRRASAPSPAWTWSAPQHAPVGVGHGERRPGQPDERSRRAVRVAHPGVHHAAGEQPHVADRSGRTAAPRRSGRRASPARRGTSRRRWATASSDDPASRARWRPSRPKPARSHRGAVRCSSASAVAGALHQAPERHAARARRLAATALHARLHEADELVVGVGTAPLHGAHGVDAAARREPLLARDPERRAVRQAQPARHARRQLVLVEVEVDLSSPPLNIGSTP